MVRTQQKERTRAAIIAAAAELVRSGADITMPAVATAARVSEATAYRYFPDLVSLLAETLDGVAEEVAAAATTTSEDPVVRVVAAAEALARHVLDRQGAVRAMIAGTVARPGPAATRPALRGGLIEHALATWTPHDPGNLDRLTRDLTVIVSAESVFTLVDLCRLSAEDAVAALVDTVRTITAARVADDRRAGTPSS